MHFSGNKYILDKHYGYIKRFYGDKKANRSGVLLINHIDEGLEILSELGACILTKSAYCVHPIFQNDKDLEKNYETSKHLHPFVVLLTMEYRKTANAYLCRPVTDHYQISDLPKINLEEVRLMLIADKTQNQRDFLGYHKNHERYNELDKYFKLWLEHLRR